MRANGRVEIGPGGCSGELGRGLCDIGGPLQHLAVGTFEPRHAAQVADEHRQAGSADGRRASASAQVASRRVSLPQTARAPVVQREAQASLIVGAAF